MTTTSPAGLAAGRWTVDPAHSTATFRVSNLGRTVTGTVPVTEGTVDVDSSADGGGGLPRMIFGSLDLAAIDTGHARRDKDLRNTITASLEGWRVTGQLSARGTRVPVAGDVAVSRHDRSATVTARTRLDRRDLGVRAPRIMIGHTIDITVTATLRLVTPRG